MTYLPRCPHLQIRKLCFESAYFLLNLALLTLLHAPNFYDSDEGLILNGAWNLYNGRNLYIDFFEYVPPGSFYLVYAIWLLTGATYWAAQLLGIVSVLLGAAGVQLIATLILRESEFNAPPWSVRITSLLFCACSAVWPIINHNTFSIVIVIWVVYFLLRAIRQQSSRDNIIAGILAGVTFTFLQHRALAVAAGALSTYFLMWLRNFHMRWLKYGIQFVLTSLIVPAMLLVLFPPAVLFDDLYQFPAVNYWHANRVNPTPLIVATVAIALVSWYLRKEWNNLIALLAVQQCALLLSTIARPDLNHVVAVIFPMLCLLPLVIAQFVRYRTDSILNVSSAPMWLTVVVFFFGAMVRLFVLSSGGEPKIIAYVRENCTSSPYLYAGPFIPGVYFETRKLNATRYSVLITGINTDAQFRDATASLSRLQIPCAVMNYNMVKQFGYSRQNPIDEYLDENYRVVLDDGGFRVLKRATGVRELGGLQ